MASIKELKNRIKSIKSTRKITRALQMVSAAKMRKSQIMVLQSRNYSSLAWGLIGSVIGKSSGVTPESGLAGISGIENSGLDTGSEAGMTQLMREYPKAKKIGLVLISTNGGFVGSMNTNLFNAAIKIMASEEGILRLAPLAQDDNSPKKFDVISEIITYGKKGQAMMLRMGKNVSADFPKKDKYINADEIYPIARMISQKYQSGEYKKIYLVYNHFVSTLLQKPTIKQLLPFQEVRQEGADKRVQGQNPDPSTLTPSDYLFEPSPAQVLEHLLPRIIESQIYQAILENDASEHSARMVAMKNATEAAGDLISDYTLTYNQLRQGKITTELAEITAGKIALE